MKVIENFSTEQIRVFEHLININATIIIIIIIIMNHSQRFCTLPMVPFIWEVSEGRGIRNWHLTIMLITLLILILFQPKRRESGREI